VNPTEFDAGPGRKIAVYTPPDTGGEIDTEWTFGQVAADAAARASQGWQILSMTVVPLRHSAAFIAREGSGFESKISVVVLYGETAAA
jgi:hypothetical protein